MTLVNLNLGDLTQNDCFLLHPSSCEFHFSLQQHAISLCVYTIFSLATYQLMGIYLGCFYLLAIVTRAAMNMDDKVCL